MTDQITRLLDQVDRLDQQATQGPWDYENLDTTDPEDPSGRFVIYSHAETDYPHLEEVIGYEDKPGTHYENAVLIALSRTALPQLAKAVKTILSECESFEVAHDDEDNPFHQGVHWTVMAIRQAITDAMNGADDD